MNRDFVEMLTALSAEGVEFLIVGAYAVAGHGLPPNRTRRREAIKTPAASMAQAAVGSGTAATFPAGGL